MPQAEAPAAADPAGRVNVADRLATHAARTPDAAAVVEHRRRGCREATFGELDRDATHLARGLAAMGVRPGHRIALLVRPGVEFVTLVFALLRSGAVMVLVDGGLGRRNIVRCLESTRPDGFVAIPAGHALRVLKRKRFPNARLNVTVGRRWFWRGETLPSLRGLPTADCPLPTTKGDDPAAVVFTSGSTGPPKGVAYRHETFATQCDQIQRRYGLRPGAVDLACFPLFGLFNVACGVTTVLPEMDFSRPASCDPRRLLAAANDWKVSQSFASPAVWDRLSRHAEQTGERAPTLQKVFSCGAPVPAGVIRRTLAMAHPDAELHTPYGATEALPVATIEAGEILGETAAKTDQGAGVCVGKKFDSIDWRVIRITDEPIATIDQAEELPAGEIGELVVRGPQVSRSYIANDEARMTNDEPVGLSSSFVIRASSFHNQLAKIVDAQTIWHRMGDVGYLDDQGRFWYCGRKSQRVRHANGDLFADRIEAVINTLPNVKRSALVGVNSQPVIIAQPYSAVRAGLTWEDWLEVNPRVAELWYGSGSHDDCGKSFTSFPRVLVHPNLPTDIRHNSKIRREELTV
ncbi:MAG: fatty acid CoA ligase family protein, partial [Planctomycetota bacterium]